MLHHGTPSEGRARRRVRAILLMLLVAGGIVGAGSGASHAARRSAPAGSSAIDPTHIPIGDGFISLGPSGGWVWACATRFGGGGAFVDGPWIHDDGTYDATAKTAVSGQVGWSGRFSVTLEGGTRVVSGNGLPDHPTGVFPIARDDPAYAYDRNPNAIAPQALRVELPATPELADQASCVPMGPIGVLLTGSVFFNALDAGGRDAVAHEVLDGCHGHPEPSGVYHYHSLTPCLVGGGTGHSPLAGYAFDGFGIFGPHGESGEELSSADLDECHGHTHAIAWDGQVVVMYHYHATADYPYTVGCYRGTPVRGAIAGSGRPPGR